MHLFVMAMYQAWCCGQSIEVLKKRSSEFVTLAAKSMSHDEEYMEQWLQKQPWFIR